MRLEVRRLALVAWPLLGMLAGCLDLELPSSEAVKKVFTEHEQSRALTVPQPEGVPLLKADELGGWRLLCDQCHQGPHYSSQTFLTWRHRDECLKETSCLECHGEHLHRLDVRGSKALCIDCHLKRDDSLACAMCHAEGWQDIHTPQGHALESHGSEANENSNRCDSCHGSQNWCIDCHGLQMPHPETILHDHPSLVRGNPETCAACHGVNSCESCHAQRGIGF